MADEIRDDTPTERPSARERPVIDIPDPKPGDLTLGELQELEERASQGDEQAQARLDECMSELRDTLTKIGSLDAYKLELRTTLANIDRQMSRYISELRGISTPHPRKATAILRNAQPTLSTFDKARRVAQAGPAIPAPSSPQRVVPPPERVQPEQMLEAISDLHRLGLRFADQWDSDKRRSG
jgi:hypothetical protein